MPTSRHLKEIQARGIGAARQRGLGGWGTMLLMVLLIGVAVLGMRLVPLYIDSFSIKEGLASLGEQDLAKYSSRQIKDALLKRLDISGVQAVTYKNFKERVTIEKKGDKVHVLVRYREERPLVANLAVIASFEHELKQN